MTTDRAITRQSIDDAIVASYKRQADQGFNSPSFDLSCAAGELVFQVQKQFLTFHRCANPRCDTDPKCPEALPWEDALLEMYREATSAIERDFLASSQLHLRRMVERFAAEHPEASA